MMARQILVILGWKRPLQICLTLSLMCLWLLWVDRAWSQMTLKEQEACSAQLGLPTVPLKDPRQAQGTEPGERWQVKREGQDRTPMASFIDTLRGNDAAIVLVIGQGRLMTLKSDIVSKTGTPVIAVGDPTVLEFQVLPNPRMIRLIGLRAGITDLSIVTADGQTYSYEVHVVFDLEMLRAHLRQVFPDTEIRLAQLRNQVVVEGEARNISQVNQILGLVEGDLEEAQPREARQQGLSSSRADNSAVARSPTTTSTTQVDPRSGGSRTVSKTESAGPKDRERIINLLRVPGTHQVMLQVRLAEVNRTALREIGADILGVDPRTGSIYGTNLATGTAGAVGTASGGAIAGLAANGSSSLGKGATAFGIFPSANFDIMIRALRQNSLLSILAEPNLMAMSGHSASFLAGGQFPVPVPQGGTSNVVTIEWKNFGVQLNFVPYVLEDESIRLAVSPEVSTIDFAIGTTIVQGGSVVPGVNTRTAQTTVELRQGQTLAIAGLLNVTLEAQTSRIPGLGDMPYLGPLFSNTSHKRTEKELLVLVTPFLVAPMNADQVPALPGADIKDPKDLEFYLKNHIEGQKDPNYRSTANWDTTLRCKRMIKLEKNCVSGPVGFSQ